MIRKLKKLWCKLWGHRWRIARYEYDSYAMQYDYCQRCGIRDDWQLEAYDAPAYARKKVRGASLINDPSRS